MTAQSVSNDNSYGAFVFEQRPKMTNRFKLTVPEWQLGEVTAHIPTNLKEL